MGLHGKVYHLKQTIHWPICRLIVSLFIYTVVPLTNSDFSCYAKNNVNTITSRKPKNKHRHTLLNLPQWGFSGINNFEIINYNVIRYL